MKKIYAVIDHLMQNPSALNLMTLNKVLRLGIPFNAPHDFKIVHLDQKKSQVQIPMKRANYNHIGGIHACAMATAGEYAAGLSLISSFGISKYRLIMSDLSAKYVYQGKEELIAECDKSQIDIPMIKDQLNREGRYLQTLVTKIYTKAEKKEVATITMTWQLKNWDHVKTK